MNQLAKSRLSIHKIYKHHLLQMLTVLPKIPIPHWPMNGTYIQSPNKYKKILFISSNAFEDCVLLSSITRCIVQLEVVDCVSNILFGRNAFKIEGPTKRILPSTNNQESPTNQSEDSASIGELPVLLKINT